MTDETKFLDRIDKKIKERLDEKFESNNKLDKEKWDNNNLAHCQIIEHLKKTNGRVTKNEKFVYSLTGAISLLAFLITIFGIFLISEFR